MERYRVIATHSRTRVVLVVEAKNGGLAAAEARRRAKENGMSRIIVNSVKRLDQLAVRFAPSHGAPSDALGGTCGNTDWSTIYVGMTRPKGVTALSVNQLNAKIEHVWDRFIFFTPKPAKPPLKAYELQGRAFLDDGISGRQELYERSLFELAQMLYDWSTYAGYYCDEFGQFIEEVWAW